MMGAVVGQHATFVFMSGFFSDNESVALMGFESASEADPLWILFRNSKICILEVLAIQCRRLQVAKSFMCFSHFSRYGMNKGAPRM
jgi:hypothetical protein